MCSALQTRYHCAALKHADASSRVALLLLLICVLRGSAANARLLTRTLVCDSQMQSQVQDTDTQVHSPHSTSGAHSTVAREAQAPTEQGDDVPAAHVDEKKKVVADTADVKVVAAAAVVESVMSVRVHRVQQHMSSHFTNREQPSTHPPCRVRSPAYSTHTRHHPTTLSTLSLPRGLSCSHNLSHLTTCKRTTCNS